MSPVPYIRLERHDGVPVARLEGEIDVSRARDLRAELVGAVANEDLGMVVDLSEVTFLDSSAVTVLFELAERLEGRQQLLAAVVAEGGLVERVATLVNLGAVVPLHAGLSEAVARVRALAPQDQNVPPQ